MDPVPEQPIVTVFRSRLRPDAHANGYGELARRMEERARSLPGFVDFATFTAEDGERVSVVTFATLEDHEAWRHDPEHVAAQRRGRDEFYETYAIEVCRRMRHTGFTAPG